MFTISNNGNQIYVQSNAAMTQSWHGISYSTTVTQVLHALQWRHNERVDVSNHDPRDYLLNHLFRLK